jgi:hypothetical protein
MLSVGVRQIGEMGEVDMDADMEVDEGDWVPEERGERTADEERLGLPDPVRSISRSLERLDMLSSSWTSISSSGASELGPMSMSPLCFSTRS